MTRMTRMTHMIRRTPNRMVMSLAVLAAGVSLLGFGAHSAFAADAAADAGGDAQAQAQAQSALQARRAQRRAEVQRRLQARLDEAAARLQIRASQEPAWNDFANAMRGLAQPPGTADEQPRSNRPQDAAAILHRRADLAMARARALAKMADATTKLQAALDPNQREVLGQIVRERLGRERGFRPRGMMGPRGMMRPGMHERLRERGAQRPGAAAAPDAPPPAAADPVGSPPDP